MSRAELIAAVKDSLESRIGAEGLSLPAVKAAIHEAIAPYKGRRGYFPTPSVLEAAERVADQILHLVVSVRTEARRNAFAKDVAALCDAAEPDEAERFHLVKFYPTTTPMLELWLNGYATRTDAVRYAAVALLRAELRKLTSCVVLMREAIPGCSSQAIAGVAAKRAAVFSQLNKRENKR